MGLAAVPCKGYCWNLVGLYQDSVLGSESTLATRHTLDVTHFPRDSPHATQDLRTPLLACGIQRRVFGSEFLSSRVSFQECHLKRHKCHPPSVSQERRKKLLKQTSKSSSLPQSTCTSVTSIVTPTASPAEFLASVAEACFRKECLPESVTYGSVKCVARVSVCKVHEVWRSI